MRARTVLGLWGAAVCAGAVATAGCSHYYDEYYLSLVGAASGTGAGSTTSTSSTSSTGDGGTDGDSGPPSSCIPSENAGAVADTCGVFVSSSKGSDTTGKGTKEAPYQTLGKALGEAKGQPVYACGEAFSEPVTLSASVELYGALDCAKGKRWAYDASTKTQLTAGADEVPLSLTTAASGSAVYDFAVTAANAMKAGGSSIAVLDEQADLTLERVDVGAGAGKDGDPGPGQGPGDHAIDCRWR